MPDVTPGTRLRSAVCAAEVVIVRADDAQVDLRCGGHPMIPLDDDAPDALDVKAGFDGGCLLGKRYTDAAGRLEVLCTKAGTSSLSVGEEALAIKGAKPLPSSD